MFQDYYLSRSIISKLFTGLAVFLFRLLCDFKGFKVLSHRMKTWPALTSNLNKEWCLRIKSY